MQNKKYTQRFGWGSDYKAAIVNTDTEMRPQYNSIT
jgi:hypothetical protein